MFLAYYNTLPGRVWVFHPPSPACYLAHVYRNHNVYAQSKRAEDLIHESCCSILFSLLLLLHNQTPARSTSHLILGYWQVVMSGAPCKSQPKSLAVIYPTTLQALLTTRYWRGVACKPDSVTLWVLFFSSVKWRVMFVICLLSPKVQWPHSYSLYYLCFSYPIPLNKFFFPQSQPWMHSGPFVAIQTPFLCQGGFQDSLPPNAATRTSFSAPVLNKYSLGEFTVCRGAKNEQEKHGSCTTGPHDAVGRVRRSEWQD